jgi:hypothetical protein
MSVPLFQPSCEVVQEQLAQFVQEQQIHAGEIYRPTVICALYAPETDRLALVRSTKAVDQETPDEALKFAQGGVKTRLGETVTGAFEREVFEELELSTVGLLTVHGLHMNGLVTVSRSKHSNRPSKAFGVLCGITEGEPALTANWDEHILSAGWYKPEKAENTFLVQEGHPPLRERGVRNLRILDAIRALDLSRP